jgi:acetoin utilization protein AcuB
MTISEIMNTKIISLHPKDDISRAKEVFAKYDIHHIPVLSDNKVIGIISNGDYLAFVKNQEIGRYHYPNNVYDYKVYIEDIMTKNPWTVTPDTKLKHALNLMIEHRINCILITENNELIGIVTGKDIYKAFAVIL